MKILITKQMSQDEQVQATFDAKDIESARRLSGESYELLDTRLFQQSMRVVDAMKETEGLPPAVRQCINATMGVLFGRPGAMQEMAVAKEHLEKEASAKAAPEPLFRPTTQEDIDAAEALKKMGA